MKEPYLAYMLRLWKAGGGADASWRASLEDPHTGERHAFASMEALVAFLQALPRYAATPTSTGDVDGSTLTDDPG